MQKFSLSTEKALVWGRQNIPYCEVSKGSCLLWGVFFSKIKDALLQSPGCHIPCSVCFFREPAALLPQHKLVTHRTHARRSSHARCICSARACWPREPGLCFPAPAPQTRVTGLSQPQLLGAVSFSLMGTSRRQGANATPSRRKQP